MEERQSSHRDRVDPRLKKFTLCRTFCDMGFQILYVTSCPDLDLVVRYNLDIFKVVGSVGANTILLYIHICGFLANTALVSRTGISTGDIAVV
jgi:hypothetical protein